MAPLTTYDQGGYREDLSDVYQMLVGEIKNTLERIGIGGPAAKATRHEWVEGELGSNVSATAAAGAAATAGSTVSVTVVTGDGEKFRVGDIFRIVAASATGGGYYRVTAIATDTLTCVAGPDGVDCPAYANGAVIQIVARPVLENASISNTDRTADVIRSTAYNYTQIFYDYVEVTDTQEAIDKAGVKSDVAEQTNAKLREIDRQMNTTLLMGKRSATAGSTTVVRHAGGLNHFLQGGNVVDASGAALSLTLINRLARDIYDDGGNPDLIIAHPIQKQKISQLYADRVFVSQGHGEIGENVGKVLTDFGEVSVIMDNQAPSDRVFLVDTSRIKVIPLQGRAIGIEVLARDGLVQRKLVSGEYTVEVRNGAKAHGFLYNLSTS